MPKSVAQINQVFLKTLSEKLEVSESHEILKHVWQHFFSWPFLEKEISEDDFNKINLAIQRIALGEPLQYVVQRAWFCGLEFEVNSSVLIPRPETEELVYWILETPLENRGKILDLATGSGCIAISLSRLGDFERVAGLDVSKSALEIAKKNNRSLGAKVDFFEADILVHKEGFLPDYQWDVWVSNPPYVCKSEARQMARNVLDYEPSLALFVPDENPLVFYEKIGKLGLNQIKPGGYLFFEINQSLGEATRKLMEALGYKNVELKRDLHGNHRMIRAQKALGKSDL
jgi:release factor glutamine methyltransferase